MRPSPTLLASLLFPAALTATPSRVQSPDAPWKTYTTPHYRIHFPAHLEGGFEPFALEVASKIEGIHAKVTEWVGFEAKASIDVVLRDPVLEANGMAVSMLKRPYVELWKTVPEPESAIGHHTSWVDLLVVHELAHIHHLTRPQNQPNLWEKLLDMPVGPLARKTPRWVVEGYATLIEGRITGSGRPHSVYRAAVIRQWALQGKLPDYHAVSGAGGFRGGSMAYLIGSAYLEWLERQNPKDPDILKKLWKQLISKKRRGFDASFRATFGLDAKDGYDRWRAEVIHDALALERRFKEQNLGREGELVARFPGEVTHLAVSPDGTKLLGRVVTPKKPAVFVWDLVAKADEKPVKPKKVEKPDANEVEDRAPEYKAPKVLAELRRRNGYLPRQAWWTSADRVTFELRQPNAEGVLEPTFLVADLKTRRVDPGARPAAPQASAFQVKELDGTWNLVKTGPEGQVQRLTRTLSAAWQPTPSPDGKWLYYVQLSAQGCEIRKLDLGLAPLEEKPLPVDPAPLAPHAILSPADEPSLLPPPAQAPPIQDYCIASTHDSGARFGYTLMPSGRGMQLGWGGSDLLGRLNWQVLAGMGAAMGPRGATFGLGYRGWRLSPTLEVFSSLEKPSQQLFAPVTGLDRERRGGELAFTYLDLGTSPWSARAVVASERAEHLDSGQAVQRSLGGLAWNFSASRSRGEDWGLGLRGEVRYAVGRTDGQGWRLLREALALRLRTPQGALTLKGEYGQMHGRPTALDRFHLGGETTSLVPASLDWNRAVQVALSAFQATGDRLARLRAEYFNDLRFYLEHSAVWNQALGRPSALRVVGVELPLHEMVPAQLAERLLGRFTCTLGVHRPLDGVMKDRTVGTFSLVLRP